jgi:hypothetical protein
LLPEADAAWPEDAGDAMQLFLDEQTAVLPVITSGEAPGAVLYDIGGYAGRVAAHRWGFPRCSCHRRTSRGRATRKRWRSSPPS